MCSIYGAIGLNINEDIFQKVRRAAGDRGRDGGTFSAYLTDDGRVLRVGSWRATPTTEAMSGRPLGPYSGIVHNGTIANDHELGNHEGAIDSEVLPSALVRNRGIDAFTRSLQRVKGSYAIAATHPDGIWLACNYKPIHYLALDSAIYFASMERHLLPIAPFGVRPAKVPPYTVLDLPTGVMRGLRRIPQAPVKALVVCSSGLDSTTAAYMLKAMGHEVVLLHFRYGARAEGNEMARVKRIAEHLNAPYAVLEIDYHHMRGASPLLNPGAAIASGEAGAEFAHEWVPARNLVMLSHAVAYAEANGCTFVALGNNLEEAGAYPDNEEEFTHLFDQLLPNAVADGGWVQVVAPVGNLMKHEIVRAGRDVGVPFELTWSCYQDGDRHCGQCGPCFMRREAFARNNMVDPVFAANEV